MKCLRVAHLEPVHCDVHVQTPGEEQVPPLEQTGEQTAIKKKNFLSSEKGSHVRAAQIGPVCVAGHEQTFGAEQAPPLRQVGEQTATTYDKISEILGAIVVEEHNYFRSVC